MSKKINVAILFGGKSVEHEVSLQSGRNVALALDFDRYRVHYIGIDKQGNWNKYDPGTVLRHVEDPKAICLGPKGPSFHPFDWSGIDVVFPILHGTLGEDGTVQGLLRLAGMPFVGADVLGSAIGMNKIIAKRLAKEAGISTASWITLRRGEAIQSEGLQYPLFVKPINGGSSVGISKVYKPSDLHSAVELAFLFSESIFLEEAIEGREIQVAVMGDRDPVASLPCEIIPRGEFHTYESKYIDQKGAQFLYPAPIEMEETKQIQAVALELYQTLCCEIFGRVDLFLTSEGEIFFNEINTIPGLTSMSPYSKMWEVSGVSYGELIDRLIALALERYERQKKLITTFDGVKTS